MSAIEEKSSSKSFEGFQKFFSHKSSELDCEMNFGVYLPPQAESESVPVIYFLSDMSCTEENFLLKSGVQKYASENGIMIVCPDTSPRNLDPPVEGLDDSTEFGYGAGFYVDATEEKFKKNFRMYSYVTNELPEIINSNFSVDPEKQSIMGHGMGGHGAMICALRNPGKYKSVSAFAPICNPIECPWGKKAFTGYLGPNSEAWEEWDSTLLVKNYEGPPLEILLDHGTDDKYLESELLISNLEAASKEAVFPLVVYTREHYDHGYFYISSFIGDHIAYHLKYLIAEQLLEEVQEAQQAQE